MSEWDALLRIGLALLAGALLGLEREFSDKPAGVRTYALVSEGSAIFMVLGILVAGDVSAAGSSTDPTRIASTVVQGIGFLAGGVIFTIRARVRGLTTAAGIWVAAAVGLAIGGGFFILGFGGVVLTVLALRLLLPITNRIPGERRYEHQDDEGDV